MNPSTVNPSPNYSILNEEKSKNFDLNTTQHPNVIAATYKRKLSLKGHNRPKTETTLMERIIKSSNTKKSKNKSKLKILNHIQKKILNISSSKSREPRIEKKELKAFSNTTTLKLRTKERRNTTEINKTISPSPVNLIEANRSRSRAKKNRLFFKIDKRRHGELTQTNSFLYSQKNSVSYSRMNTPDKTADLEAVKIGKVHSRKQTIYELPKMDVSTEDSKNFKTNLNERIKSFMDLNRHKMTKSNLLGKDRYCDIFILYRSPLDKKFIKLSIKRSKKEIVKEPQPASSTNFSTSMGSNFNKEGMVTQINLYEEEVKQKLSIEQQEYSQINEKVSEEEKSSDERFSGNTN